MSIHDKKHMPEGWRETTLGNLIFPVSETYNFSNLSEIHFLNTGDIQDGKLLHNNFSKIQSLPGQAKKKFKKGDILFSEIRPENKRFMLVNFDAENSVASTRLMVLRSKDGVDVNFIYKFITSENVIKEFQVIAESRSGTFPQITFEAIAGFSVLLPPLPEQGVIAEMLSSLDAKIELLREQNETLEKTAQTIFHEWFGRYSVESPEDLPEGWRVENLDGLLDLIIDYRGKTPKKLGMDWSENGIPALSAKSIKNGSIVREESMNYGSDELYSIWMKDELRKGDFLITSEAPLGEMYYLADEKKYILSQRLFALRVNNKITSEYLYYYFYSPKGQQLLSSRSSGSTVEGIRQSELRMIKVIVPSKDALLEISSVLRTVIEKKSLNEKEIQSLSKTRDTLLPKLMSGDVKIPTN